MNWNEAVQQLAETHWSLKTKEELLVSCIETSLRVFPDSAPTGNWGSLIASMKQYNKPIPGFRYFHCDECNRRFWHKTRDCLSPSNETCPECFADVRPHDREEHPEWLIDKSGNLV